MSEDEKDWNENEALKIHIVSDEVKCDEVVKYLKSFNYIGFDCEGYPTLSRKGKISLIQLSTEYDSFLFDIPAFDHKVPSILQEILKAERPIKVIHDSRGDIDALTHGYGVTVKGIFDTSVANMVEFVRKKRKAPGFLTGQQNLARFVLKDARFRNIPVIYPVSNATEQIVWDRDSFNVFDGKDPIKKEMNTDKYLWKKRPMTRDMTIYAGMDAFVSLMIGFSFLKKWNQEGDTTKKVLALSKRWSKLTKKPKNPAEIPRDFKRTLVWTVKMNRGKRGSGKR